MCRDPSGSEVPGHELIEFLAGVPASETLQCIGKPSKGIDGVELGGLDEAGDDGPVVAAVVGAGKEEGSATIVR
jgi:hypothetical protein